MIIKTTFDVLYRERKAFFHANKRTFTHTQRHTHPKSYIRNKSQNNKFILVVNNSINRIWSFVKLCILFSSSFDLVSKCFSFFVLLFVYENFDRGKGGVMEIQDWSYMAMTLKFERMASKMKWFSFVFLQQRKKNAHLRIVY